MTTTLEQAEIPEGGIRFKEALKKYTLPNGTLGNWVTRGHVHVLKRLSWKYSILCEADVQRMVDRLRDNGN